MDFTGFMGSWNAMMACTRHAVQACQAAIKIRDAFAAEAKTEELTLTSLFIGVWTGKCLAGAFGTKVCPHLLPHRDLFIFVVPRGNVLYHNMVPGWAAYYFVAARGPGAGGGGGRADTRTGPPENCMCPPPKKGILT